ncbi:hypothetical protein ACQE3E_09725 [Methylomonas sp. MED-D]|uniref:hypothetical protein n=1 Tax=Methylomonas TaxID=416 RepID=UPI000AEAC2CF|nr:MULTISPECIES: hypothetical protein [Methylomonas]MDT4328809.1 hypothetical protein [Methylomonas sp. MV1]NJA06836.1 hypothetical protein [Methylococcaceae bacterium WWC4]WGS87978.1 hypothetical protein QC632_09505 [Methylomonas sp. UP202]
MTIPKIGKPGPAIGLLASAGVLAGLPLEFVVSALLFAAVIRGSVYMIDRAIQGDPNT